MKEPDDGFGSAPSPGSAAPLDETDAPGDLVVPEERRYAPGGELGRGAMGRVFSAFDLRLRREVAVKVLRAGQDPRRLAREARITAGLEHPGIVPVYDAGLDPDGRPFYAMRQLHGRTLEEVLLRTPAAHRLDLVRRLLDAVEAVAYAHARGVVHRDLKPSNVLLGDYGETHVVDWGLARGDEGPCSDDPRLTRAGGVLGTPSYMSPEQAAGGEADARSDVWSLGVILHEIVSGAPPFRGSSADEVLVRVRTEAPAVFREPPELAAIANRALQRDPAARYADAGALAVDLSAWIDGRRVGAYHYGPWELARRAIAAWRVPLAVAAVALVLLLAVGAWALVVTSAERDAALAARALADRRLAESQESQALAAYDAGLLPEAAALAAQVVARLDAPRALGLLAAVPPLPPHTSSDLPGCLPRALGPRGVACGGAQLSYADWTAPVAARSLTFSPGGALWATTDESVVLLDPDTGQVRTELVVGATVGLLALDDTTAMHRVMRAPAAVFHADGAVDERVFCPGPNDGLVLGRGRDGLLAACGTGELVAGDRSWSGPFGGRGTFAAASALAQHDLLIVGTLEGELVSLDVNDGAVVAAASVGGLVREVVATEGLVAALVERIGVVLWHPRTGAVLGQLPAPGAQELRFDGPTTLWVAGASLTRWQLDALAPRVLPRAAGLSSVRFAPDGRHLVTTHGDGATRVIRLADGAVLTDLRWQDGVVKEGAFTRDGRFLAMGMDTHDVRAWDAGSWAPLPSLTVEPAVAFRDAVALADGTVLAVTFARHDPVVFAPGSTRGQHAAAQLDALAVSSDPAGRTAALATRSGLVLWDGAPRVIRPGEHHAVALGERLVVGASAQEVVVVRRDGTLVERLPVAGVAEVLLTPSELIVLAGLDGLVRVYRGARLLAELRGHSGRVVGLDLAPDGRTLATASWDGTARLWDLSALDAAVR